MLRSGSWRKPVDPARTNSRSEKKKDVPNYKRELLCRFLLAIDCGRRTAASIPRSTSFRSLREMARPSPCFALRESARVIFPKRALAGHAYVDAQRKRPGTDRGEVSRRAAHLNVALLTPTISVSLSRTGLVYYTRVQIGNEKRAIVHSLTLCETKFTIKIFSMGPFM